MIIWIDIHRQGAVGNAEKSAYFKTDLRPPVLKNVQEVNMKKCKLKLGCTFLLVLVILILLYITAYFYPVEYALDKNNLTEYKDFILVERREVTGAEWMIVGNSEQIDLPSEQWRYVHLVGNTPNTKYSVDISYSMGNENQFLCYVDYIGKGTLDGHEYYEVYNVKDCKIVAPIRTDTIINMPENYVNLIEALLHKKGNNIDIYVGDKIYN